MKEEGLGEIRCGNIHAYRTWGFTLSTCVLEISKSTRSRTNHKPRPHYAEWCRATGSIDTVEQVWTCRPALLSHAGSNRTQPESSRYGSKEVDATSVVWTCCSVLFNLSRCVYSVVLFKIVVCLRL